MIPSSTKKDLLLPWIKAGYSLFAKEGPQGLKVEVIARRVNKSKSSFYHHFADLEVFTEFLLDHHLKQSAEIAELEKSCKTIDPELIDVLIGVKEDLLFNRQLRFHRDNLSYKACFEKANEEVGEALLEVWANDLGLEGNLHLAKNMFELALENFYLQINEETLNKSWLSQYFQQIKSTISGIKKL